MAKDVYNTELTDIMPENLLESRAVKYSADTLASQLSCTVDTIKLIEIIAHIDELPEDIVDSLAWQWRVDFYDYALPLAKRRTLVKNSIRWHMKKGTKAVVEEVIRAIFNSGIVEEWFEYGGRPDYFRCNLPNPDTPLTKEQIQQCLRAIGTVKNVRSWLDGLGFERTIDIPSKVFSAMTSFKEYASGPVRPKDAILYKKLFVTAVISEYREVELT